MQCWLGGGRNQPGSSLAIADPDLVAMMICSEISALTWKALFLLCCSFLFWENFPRHPRLCAASQGVLWDWQKWHQPVLMESQLGASPLPIGIFPRCCAWLCRLSVDTLSFDTTGFTGRALIALSLHCIKLKECVCVFSKNHILSSTSYYRWKSKLFLFLRKKPLCNKNKLKKCSGYQAVLQQLFPLAVI